MKQKKQKLWAKAILYHKINAVKCHHFRVARPEPFKCRVKPTWDTFDLGVFFATYWPLYIFILLHTNTKSLKQKYPTWTYSHKYTLKKSTTLPVSKESIINMEKKSRPRNPIEKTKIAFQNTDSWNQSRQGMKKGQAFSSQHILWKSCSCLLTLLSICSLTKMLNLFYPTN